MTTEALQEVSGDIDDSELFKRPELIQKKKILFISDHPLHPSGVGVQSRFLIDGLISTGKYTFRCLGGAMKHPDYNVVHVNPDFVIKPVNGFGDKAMVRHLLIQEKPDAVVIFTDPRQFYWLWEMEDEIHQVCPIAYWHVWDNDPYPDFNNVWYESTDLINCISQKTYDLVKPNFPERTNYIPHAFPESVYHPIDDKAKNELLKTNFAEREDWYKVLWVNRNAHRKNPSDVLLSWKIFLAELQERHGHQKALLIMHTNPQDREGPNLAAVVDHLGLQENVWFSTDTLGFPDMNALYNVADTLVNISKAEGYGLSTHIAMQVGKPVIALKTGGETSKVVDSKDPSKVHGVALDPVKRSLIGSQWVPYIFEDYSSTEEVAKAYMAIYEMSPEQKAEMKEMTTSYIRREFGYDDMVNKWDETLEKVIADYKAGELPSTQWVCKKMNNSLDSKESK